MEPKVVGVNGKAEPEPPQALPVFEMVPSVAKVAQPAVPPALETVRFVVEAVPETERAVVVAPPWPMEKTVVEALVTAS